MKKILRSLAKPIINHLKSLFTVALMLGSIMSFAQTAPTITSFSPASGAIGSSVSITGTGFNTTAAQDIVFFGATQAMVTAASTTSLTVTVPIGATYQYISVTNLAVNLTAYSAQPFIVTLAGNIAFANKQDFTTSTNPRSVSIGDIDGDGKPDLAVVNGNSSTVSVFRNTSTSGTVSFAGKVDFTTSSFPYSVSITDIDGDGKPDLAVANQGSNTVSVFRNTSASGTVSFATKVDFTTGGGSFSLSIGDIDGDGKPDLAVTNYGSNTVSVIQQEGLPQGSLTANGPICSSDTGQLTWTATAGTWPFTVVYNDGTANRTATNVSSGIPFNVFTNPVTANTTYTLVSVTYPNNAIRSSGFTGSTATIAINYASSSSTSVTNCDSYVWNGTIYTASGNYSFDTGNDNAVGCDSLATLILTINLSSSSSASVTACDNYSWNGSTYTSSATYTFDAGAYSNSAGCDSVATLALTITGPCFVTLNLKMFIQGYYSGGAMLPVLFNEGVDANPASTNVDTVTISLIDPLVGTVVQTSKGILQTNGSMSVTFPASVTGNYFYIYIQHRNSIETSSRHPVLFTSITSYDFSTGAAQAFGNNMAQVAPGVWAIYTGDINQDGLIDPYDFAPYDFDNSIQLTGVYKDAQGYSTDLNGDGYVHPYDFSVYDMNNSKQVSANVPW